jgi:xanthine dehydrogenase FAD-binding subunit
MIPQLEYIRPKDLTEALQILGKQPESTKVIAGGTDIIPGFQQEDKRFQNIRLLIDIHQLPELKIIEDTDEGLCIGAGVTFTELANNPLVQQHYSLLARAASSVGNVQIRNRATVTGNFVNNAACADSVPALLVYDARIRVRSSQKRNETLLRDFLVKPNRTQLQPDQIVTQIILPHLPTGYRGTFYKLGRRKGTAISRITLAILLKRYDNRIEDLRIASGAVTPIGVRFPELETSAVGQELKPAFFKTFAQELGKHVINKTGIRWSTPYKLPVVEQVFYQLLSELAEASQGGEQ